jgi:beta-N-acetylhexosaminidase
MSGQGERNAAHMATDLAGMSIEEQVGQCCMAGFDGLEPTPEIVELIRRRHVGGVILFTRNIHDAHQTQKLTTTLQRIAREAGHPYPLLIAIDQENGLVRRLGPDSTSFPGNMALGAIGSEEAAFAVARATGEELRALGINMNLAPVADVNNNPANPLIGVRSFGEDPDRVARLVDATVRGYAAAGVIATLKHFPGHGDTAVDSHRSLPVVPFGLDRLDRMELVPFRQGIAAGVDCVMTAHMLLSQLDAALPATLSPAVIGGLLRERLGFNGVAMSDCLEMQAISDGVGVPQGAVLALAAGLDLVLVSHRYDRQVATIDAVIRALDEGRLADTRIGQAAERVLQLKAHRISWDEAVADGSLDAVGSAAHRELSERTYARSVTIVRDDESRLPLRLGATQKLVIVGPGQQSVSLAIDVSYPQDALVESIRTRHENVAGIVAPPDMSQVERNHVYHIAREADIILLVTINAHLDPDQAVLAADLLRLGRPVVGLVAGDPYDVPLFADMRTCLATYEYTKPALLAAARVLFGEAQAIGHLPVTLHMLASG